MKLHSHDGLTLAYRDEGQGSAVVMIHNGGTSSTIWRHQVETLSARHRVVAVDLPGFGVAPRPDTPARLDDMVDLVESLIDELDLAPALLVGNCMGTNISALLAHRRPELVSGILAVNPLTEASFSAGRIGFLHKMGDLAAAPTRFLRSLSRKIRSPRPAAVATLRFQLGRAGVDADLHHDPELLACVRRNDQMPALVDVLDDMAAYGEVDRQDLPGGIPVWIVWGEQNRVLSRHRAAHLEDRLRAGRVEVLDDCGHLPMLERPEAVTSLIEDLLEEAGSSSNATTLETSR